ncbi:MAG: hypothetical protein ACI4XG_16835 [Bradyrhizobium sp.]
MTILNAPGGTSMGQHPLLPRQSAGGARCPMALKSVHCEIFQKLQAFGREYGSVVH